MTDILEVNSLYLLLLILPLQSWANNWVRPENCRPVDVVEVKPELKELYRRPRNQFRMQWCYAFTAADLLTAELGTKVSAIQVSAHFNAKNQQNKFSRALSALMQKQKSSNLQEIHELGFVGLALKRMVDHGKACPEAKMPYDPMWEGETYRKLLALEDLKKKMSLDLTHDQACLIMKDLVPSQISNGEIHKITQQLVQQDLNLTLNTIVEKSCQNSYVDIPKLQVKQMMPPFTGALQSNGYVGKLNQLLKQGKPFGIEYKLTKAAGKNIMHTSIVTAMKWENGRCHFKIRDSFGKNCEGLKPHIKCNKTDGSFWLNDDDFMTSLFNVTYVSRKSGK